MYLDYSRLFNDTEIMIKPYKILFKGRFFKTMKKTEIAIFHFSCKYIKFISEIGR